MSPRIRVAMLVVLAGLAPATGRAAAAPPPPIDLHVVGGSEGWRPYRTFELAWKIPADASPPVTAARYRLKTPGGALIREEGIGKVEALTVRVPDVPGSYSAEVWLEDGEGTQGPADVTQLRYDDQRPQAAFPLPGPEWLARTDFPFTLRIEHPGDPVPLSGIRGYAISVDRSPLGTPCADSYLCTDGETDLQGGIAVDALQIPALPDGENYVHALAVAGSGVHSAIVRHALLRVDTFDPQTEITGVPATWANRSHTLTAHASDADSGMEPGTGAFTAIRVDGGAPVRAAGDEAEAAVIAEGVHTIAYFARDAAGNVNDGATTNGVANHLPGVVTVGIDRTPPRVTFFNSLDPADPEQIRARVEDALSGAGGTGGGIGLRAAGSGDAFEPLPTRASSNALVAEWDSDAYPEGSYEFRAIGSDAAGNVASSTRRADGSEMVLSNPIKGPTVLVAGLGGGTPGARTVGYGRAVRLRGRLTTGWRRPIPAPLQVIERYGGTDRARVATTDRQGRFALRLPAGPSRELLVSFRGSSSFSASAARPLRLRVRSGVRLRVSAPVARVGGAPVVFSGAVKARRGEIPGGGKSVDLQFRAGGLPWQEFRTIETDRHGRFRFAYRFSDDDSRGVRFRFRAHAAAQEGWPYEPADSSPVAVRGR